MKPFLFPVLTCLLLNFPRGAAAADFDFAVLQERARTVAAVDYRAPAVRIPAWIQALDYDTHRAIYYDLAHAWWAKEKLPFQLQFFHPGWLFKTSIQVHELTAGRVHPINFSPELFNYGSNTPGEVPPDLGFAGLRIHGQLNQPGDEIAVFLGGSYFRSVGRGQQYGLSARGLALNSGEPGDEEFPRFEEFWVERPAVDAQTITVFALLNSPSVAGAYRFVIQPGDVTVMQVKAALYFRRIPAVVGLAPLTSMFLHGENTGWSRDDFRPEVHDSDGLLMHTGTGEWLWRPLANPQNVQVTTFKDRTPRGFGLMQRDRDFTHYDDVDANYHKRPNAWVEPVGDWGPGVVRLLQFHTIDETNDNTVACWVPDVPPAIGQPLAFEYRLHWAGALKGTPPAGWVTATRQGAVLHKPDRRLFVVDFAGVTPPKKNEGVEIKLSVGPGAKIVPSPGVRWIEQAKVWRAAFELIPDATRRPVEMRCYLSQHDNILTETWSQLWNP